MQIFSKFLIFTVLFLNFGCAQRISSHVSAVAEEGYSPKGQSVSLGPLPSETQDTLPDFVFDKLKTALASVGYVFQADAHAPAAVHVRAYWQSVGPYVTIKENPLWDFGPGLRGPWQRDRYIKEEKFLRTFIVEAWSNEFAKDEVATANLAPFLQKKLSFKEALSYMPAKPARLLWRVQTRSIGNLAGVESVLPELLDSALPWIARSVDVQVMMQGDLSTNIEALE